MTTATLTRQTYAGVYLPSETAAYLRAGLPPAVRHRPTSRRVQRWISAGLTAPQSREVKPRQRILDFADLITCQVISILRSKDISLHAIREAEAYLRDHYGFDKPFAYRAVWYLVPDIFTKLDNGVLLAASRRGQAAFKFLEPLLKAVEVTLVFSDATPRARVVAWEPEPGITIQPDVQFGQSCLAGTRIPTSALWSYVAAGDPPEFVAESYGIEVADVERAVSWEERVRARISS